MTCLLLDKLVVGRYDSGGDDVTGVGGEGEVGAAAPA